VKSVSIIVSIIGRHSNADVQYSYTRWLLHDLIRALRAPMVSGNRFRKRCDRVAETVPAVHAMRIVRVGVSSVVTPMTRGQAKRNKDGMEGGAWNVGSLKEGRVKKILS